LFFGIVVWWFFGLIFMSFLPFLYSHHHTRGGVIFYFFGAVAPITPKADKFLGAFFTAKQ